MFHSPWWLPGAHAQTIYASLFPPPRVALERSRWETPDGDFIDVDFCGDPAAARRLVVFHGLEGSSDSHYGRAFAAHAAQRGWRVALPNFRGCSGEPNRRPRAYHSADSAEIDWILKRVGGPLHAVGVSLGGNALLKWLGERGAAARQIAAGAAAISAPLDLPAMGRTLDRGLNRLLYTRHFLASLIPKALGMLERFPGLFDGTRLRAATTFREFDGVVTAPLHGFRDVDDYWTTAASGQYLKGIRVPTLVINSRNDPFLPEADLVAAAGKPPPCVVLDFPRSGGHGGFVAGPFPGNHDWLPQHILGFLERQ